MLSDEQISADLARLKDIVATHKAPEAELAVHQEMVNGQELTVFSKIPVNLGQLYERSLLNPDLDFLVYQDERFTFAETLDLARRFARVLTEQYGIKRGERVAICARNSPEWCIAYMGITMTGAIVVPMNSWWQGPELQYGLKDSGSRLILADPARHAQVAPYLDELGVQLIAIKPEQESDTIPEFYSLLEKVEPFSAEQVASFDVQADDDASIMYTSGSTGEPKGVLSSHRAIISALFTWKFVKEITEELRPELRETDPDFKEAILANVPLFHVTGSHAQFLACFVYQRKFVMMYKWDASKALELIEKERISVFHGVPTMAWELMQEAKFSQTDLSSLRAVQSGGAPRPPEHLKMMLQKFPSRALPGLGYGLTETNAIGAIISGKFYEARPNSTGRPSPPVTEVCIKDEAGTILAANEVGEICIKGPSIMKGYWNKPQATAEVIKDGWFHTGDVGYLDSLGFLIISDRAKDIVIRGGENIGCAEVEYAITEHPAVNEVSVYGIPDERLGEIPAATVMLKAGQELGAAALQDFLKDKLAAFKIPEVISFRYEQLPRLGTGKIAKKLLRQETIDSLA